MASEPLEGYAPLRFVTNGLVPVAGDDDAALVAYTDLMTPAPPPSGNRTADLLALQERSVLTPLPPPLCPPQRSPCVTMDSCSDATLLTFAGGVMVTLGRWASRRRRRS
jgi:hypothetical protein